MRVVSPAPKEEIGGEVGTGKWPARIGWEDFGSEAAGLPDIGECGIRG